MNAINAVVHPPAEFAAWLAEQGNDWTASITKCLNDNPSSVFERQHEMLPKIKLHRRKRQKHGVVRGIAVHDFYNKLLDEAMADIFSKISRDFEDGDHRDGLRVTFSEVVETVYINNDRTWVWI